MTDDGPRSGDALVLLHGYACSLRWWDAILPRLAESRRVIRIDLLGHGGSAKPRSRYSFAEQGRLHGEALDRLGVRRAVVVGQAFGGILATPLAEERPDLVAGALLIGAPPDESVGRMAFLVRLGLMPVIGPAIRRVAWDGAIRRGYEAAFGHGDFSPFDGAVDPELATSDYRAMTYGSYRNARREFPDYVEEASLAERFARLRVPLLVLFGEEDAEYDARAALAIYDRVPGARTELIPETGHGPQIEKPAAVADLVVPFAEAALRRR